MLGKNNHKERLKRKSTKSTRFSIKKFSFGVASVAVLSLLSFANASAQTTQEVVENPDSQSTVVEPTTDTSTDTTPQDATLPAETDSSASTNEETVEQTESTNEVVTENPETTEVTVEAGKHIDFGKIPHRVQSGNRYSASAVITNPSEEDAAIKFGVAHLGNENHLIWDGKSVVPAKSTTKIEEAVGVAYDSSNDTTLVMFNESNSPISLDPDSKVFVEKPYTEEELARQKEELYKSLPEPSKDFRVLPYLQSPTSTSVAINWVSEFDTPGTLTIKNKETGKVHAEVEATPVYMGLAEYTVKEIQEDINFKNGNGEVQSLPKGSWLMSNENYKSEVDIINLEPNTEYEYTITQGDSTVTNTFKTFPTKDDWDHIRLVAFSDTETEPRGRLENREWELHTVENRYAEGSEERPEIGSKFQQKHGHANRRGEDIVRYPLTQAVALDENIKHIQAANPDALIIAGDLTQGSGYQPAWDEFWRHFAGNDETAGFGSNIASEVPILSALGNWETYASINNGYQNAAFSRNKYHEYMDTPGDENNPQYKDSYYRTDIGPITLITLDSTKGVPHETTKKPVGKVYSGDDSILKEELWHTAKSLDEALQLDPHFTSDTQGSFTWKEYTDMFTELYPNLTADDVDLPGFNPGTQQWLWAIEQFQDARDQGQIILVQFHHAPYSSGVHGTAPNFESPDNQSGVAMRVYTPLFEKYGVVAVISGHDEMFERSFVDKDGDGIGFQVYDVGVAADGLRSERMVKDENGNYVPIAYNTYSQWSATADSPELWKTNENGVKHLIDGGLHYGHLLIDLEKTGYGSVMTLTPNYVFPILDDEYDLIKTELRSYDDVVKIYFDEMGNVLAEEPVVADSTDETGQVKVRPTIKAPVSKTTTNTTSGKVKTAAKADNASPVISEPVTTEEGVAEPVVESPTTKESSRTEIKTPATTTSPVKTTSQSVKPAVKTDKKDKTATSVKAIEKDFKLIDYKGKFAESIVELIVNVLDNEQYLEFIENNKIDAVAGYLVEISFHDKMDKTIEPEKPVKIEHKLSDELYEEIKNGKELTIYQDKDGKAEEIDFEIDGQTVTFEVNSSGTFAFAVK